MSSAITTVGGKTNSSAVRSFVIDTREEVSKLPTTKKRGTLEDENNNDIVDMGSDCFVITDGSAWILSAALGWVEL